MAASSITIRPSAIEIARAAAAAIPAEVSTKPLLGILGVVTGAGVVTLTSRMISSAYPISGASMDLGMTRARGLAQPSISA